ncbi:hypothetical protein Tco_1266226 [Tanacetum coccineum]
MVAVSVGEGGEGDGTVEMEPWLTAVVASMVVVRVAGALAGKDEGAEMVAVMLLTSEWRWGNDEGGGVWRGGGAWRRVMDETLELIEEFHNVDKRVPTILDRERMEAIIKYMLSNQFRDAEEYAYHVQQAHNYLENKMVWKSRQEDLKRPKLDALVFYGPQRNPNEPPRIVEIIKVTTDQQYGLDYMERIVVMRENDKPYSFSEADFKYLNKNDIEDMYYLCLNTKINRENKLLSSLLTFIRTCVIWERVHDFQLGIESYQIKINLSAPTMTFCDIEACDPFSIVDKPTTGLIYLNIKNEKRFMDLEKLSKFCNATLEKVLKEVKMKIFETEFLKKAPLLRNLDLKIMKAYEREIEKRLKHRKADDRWSS